MAGLLEANRLCGNPQALRRGKNGRLGEIPRGPSPHEQMQRSLENEQGGMTEALANLYAVTGNKDYLALSAAFNHER